MKKTIIALLSGVLSLRASASGNIANGEALAKKYACASCHGANFNQPIDPTYPKLAGRHINAAARNRTGAITPSWQAWSRRCRTATSLTWQRICIACRRTWQ
jgi:mono/diheme cytochrome c family protein